MTTHPVGAANRNTRAFQQLAASCAALVIAALLGAADALASDPGDRLFTVGNYPLEARAANAVAAKEKAIADGQKAALRSLLKRLVPVTAYRRLDRLKDVKAGDFIESFAVRSERNSSTTYIASYDFAFSPDPVRKLLDREGIPYLDRPAPTVTIVPAYRVSPDAAKRLPPTFSTAAGSDAWLYAWKALDLANSLTPASLQPLKPEVHGDTIRGLAEGDVGMLRTLGQAYGTETVVLAVLEPEPDRKKLTVVLVGRDAVQNIYLKRIYRMDEGDLAYTAELAAVISLSILEGRWKAINVRDYPTTQASDPAGAAAGWSASNSPQAYEPGAAGGVYRAASPLTIAVMFQGMAEWQEISRELTHVPHVADIEVLGLSARGARVSLNYPGGAQNLAMALAERGLNLESTQEGLRLTRR
ncbi:MAG: DUF2066 domain-containing protein [Hyphomicrobiaceae bacterium]